MRISFIVPVFNAEIFLPATVESILNAGLDDVEAILVDDGSSDTSAAICQRYAQQYPGKIKFFQHPESKNKGVSATRRKGIDHATGELMFFLDSDDCIKPGVLQQYVDVFKKHSDIVLIHGNISLIDDTGKADSGFQKIFDLGNADLKYDLTTTPDFLATNHICNSTVCLRRETLASIDFHYDQAFQVEDWVLWVLLAERGKFFYISKPVVGYRFHPNSATFQVAKKGYVYYTYTLIELYMVLMVKLKNRILKKKVSNKLYEHFGMLYKFYSRGEKSGLSRELINKTFLKDYIKGVIGKKS